MIRAIVEKIRRCFAQRTSAHEALGRTAGMDDELARSRRRLEEQWRTLEALEAESKLAPHHHSRKGGV